MVEIEEGFYKMKDRLGTEKYDIMSIMVGTLFRDAVILMKKVGILEEFLEGKNELSRAIIDGILELEANQGNVQGADPSGIGDLFKEDEINE